MTRINTKGCVVRTEEGTLLHDSVHSILTRRYVGDVSVLEPVPSVDGLFVRLGRAEAPQMTEQELATAYETALSWYIEFVNPDAAHAGDIPLDEWSLDELKRWAVDFDIPGRSKMNKDELVDALAPYFADGDDADDDED